MTDPVSPGAFEDELPETDRRQDIYFGLVRAIGTDLSVAVGALTALLATAGYANDVIHHIKLSAFLADLERLDGGPGLSTVSEGRFRYYESRMDAGDRARHTYGDEVLALLAVNETNRLRSRPEPSAQGRYGDVFIFDSLMHPEEVALLRTVYGKRFFLIAVHSAAADREAALLADLRSSDPAENAYPDEPSRAASSVTEQAARKQYENAEARRIEQVRSLVERDEGLAELTTPLSPAPRGRRVSIRKTFALADVFLSAKESLAANPGEPGVLERFVMKLFDEPFITPTRSELGMAHAYVAARRSGSLARSVERRSRRWTVNCSLSARMRFQLPAAVNTGRSMTAHPPTIVTTGSPPPLELPRPRAKGKIQMTFSSLVWSRTSLLEFFRYYRMPSRVTTSREKSLNSTSTTEMA